MTHLSASELAQELKVTKGRVSQYVGEGKLDGCYTGEGRARRFDLVKVAERLGKVLDKGQMLGNGAQTRKALRQIEEDEPEAAPLAKRASSVDGRQLPREDPDRYELARTAKAEEELRRLRRQNELDEGTLVLAAEVERQVQRTIAQEVAEFEQVLREGARAIADGLGVDFKMTRKLLTDKWREHRKARVELLTEQAGEAGATVAERAADI